MRRPVPDANAPVARLAAALNPADPHTDRVLASSDAGVLEIVEEARRHRVSGLLSRALNEGGRLAALTDEARETLRRDVLAQALLRSSLETGLAAAADALDGAGITFLLLKGAALGPTIYPEPALRSMTDVDLLVAPRDVDHALAVLGAAGFALPAPEERRFWAASYYNVPLGMPEGQSVLEIHWSIAQEHRHRPDVRGLFARARAITWGGRTVHVPGPSDMLLHQALHHAYHYFEPKLLWIHDHALLHRAGPDVGEVRDRAKRWGMEVPLALSVLQLHKAFPGSADPALLEWAEDSARAGFVQRLFGSRGEVALIEGWDRRSRQLLLAVAMLDTPLQAVRPIGSWMVRALRFGDRAGARGGAHPGGRG